jgi:hypothetical protein
MLAVYGVRSPPGWVYLVHPIFSGHDSSRHRQTSAAIFRGVRLGQSWRWMPKMAMSESAAAMFIHAFLSFRALSK